MYFQQFVLIWNKVTLIILFYESLYYLLLLKYLINVFRYMSFNFQMKS